MDNYLKKIVISEKTDHSLKADIAVVSEIVFETVTTEKFFSRHFSVILITPLLINFSIDIACFRVSFRFLMVIVSKCCHT